LDFCKKSVERALASHVAWLPVSLLPEDHLSLPSLPVWIALADTDRAALYAESLPGEDRTGEAAADYMRLRAVLMLSRDMSGISHFLSYFGSGIGSGIWKVGYGI
jgi:hypothetical protein